MNRDQAFASAMLIMLLILIGWFIYMWNYHPEEVFGKFNDKEYECLIKCPLNLTACEFQDGTKSWEYCVKWIKNRR